MVRVRVVVVAASLMAGEARAADLVAAWDLSGSDEALVADGSRMQWEWGPVGAGPGSGLAGAAAWGTILDGAYLHTGDETLTLPSTALDALERPVLQLTHWYAIDPEGDAGVLETFEDGSWLTREPVFGYPDTAGFAGSSVDWVDDWLLLDGLDDSADVRLRFTSDESISLDGWYLGSLMLWDGDPVPPLVVVDQEIEDTQLLDQSLPLEVSILDDLGVSEAWLVWTVDEGDEQRAALSPLGADVYAAEISAPGAADVDVSWWIEASDGENDSTAGPWSFRAYLAAPGVPTVPDGRLVGSTVTLSWEPPESPHAVVEYLVSRDGTVVLETEDTTAELPVVDEVHFVTVSARFETSLGILEGDPSATLLITPTIPDIDPLDPAYGWQGATLRVALTGTDLLLVSGEVDLDLGDDIAVSELSVRNADRLEATLEIDVEAAVGVRSLVLTSGEVDIVELEAFTVGPASDAPQLVEVEPDAVEQGTHATLVLTANTELGDAPSLDLGEGVIIESIEIDGDEATVELAVARDAPLGERAVVLDDGTLILEGVSLRVRDLTVPPEVVCGCGTAPASSVLPLLVGLLGLIRRGRG